MKKVPVTLIAILAIVVLVGLWFASTYNSLVKLNEAIDGQWAQVENQYKRRYDLIPNLVETVKGYAQHEEEVFKSIADARAKYGGAVTVDDKAQAASQLESAISRLLLIVENYPNLKADQHFTALMDELTGTETRIAVERMRFNDNVRVFNERVKTFPTVLVARLLGFAPRAYFEAPEGAESAPPVNFTR